MLITVHDTSLCPQQTVEHFGTTAYVHEIIMHQTVHLFTVNLKTKQRLLRDTCKTRSLVIYAHGEAPSTGRYKALIRHSSDADFLGTLDKEGLGTALEVTSVASDASKAPT